MAETELGKTSADAFCSYILAQDDPDMIGLAPFCAIAAHAHTHLQCCMIAMVREPVNRRSRVASGIISCMPGQSGGLGDVE